MRPLPQIMVAPNGARLTKLDHPNLPVTQDEVVECAVACHAAGAGGLHAHIRDMDGQHLLDAEVYGCLIEALKDAVPEMAIQITTEAAGVYDAETQMQIALKSGADMVSASVREICRAGREPASDFYKECKTRGISVQHILYDTSDCELLSQTLDTNDLADPTLQAIFVLGRYSKTGSSGPEELDPFLDWLSSRLLKPDWAVCAFGPNETACLLKAVHAGGKCRVGFENSLFMSDGSLANANSERVLELVEEIRRTERSVRLDAQ